jgi:dihydropteroate synthase
MQVNPVYRDVCAEIAAFFEDRLNRLAQAGVSSEHIVLDVGIGFGKRRHDNLDLLAGLRGFARFNRPLLIGVSRKSFLGGNLGVGIEERLPGALAASCWAVRQGVQIIRTHDVKATVQAVRLTEEIAAKTPHGA